MIEVYRRTSRNFASIILQAVYNFFLISLTSCAFILLLAFKSSSFNPLFYSFQLKAPIKYNEYQSAIALASSPTSPGMKCTLSGWGQLSTHGRLPKTLQKMDQVIISQRNCQTRHDDMPLTGSHLCAFNTRGIGACQVSNVHYWIVFLIEVIH